MKTKKSSKLYYYIVGITLVLATASFIQSCSSEDEIYMQEEIENVPDNKTYVTGGKIIGPDIRIIALKNRFDNINYSKIKSNSDITEQLSNGKLSWDNCMYLNQGALSGVMVPFERDEALETDIMFLASFSLAEKTEDMIMQLHIDDKGHLCSTSFFTLEGKELNNSSIVDYMEKDAGGVMRLKSDKEEGFFDQKLTNNTNDTVYFKPEKEVTKDGKTYKNNEAYPLKPGESTTIPVDGYKVAKSPTVHKMTDGYWTCSVSTNNDNSYNYSAFYSSPPHLGKYLLDGGTKDENWLKTQQTIKSDHSWDKLFSK